MESRLLTISMPQVLIMHMLIISQAYLVLRGPKELSLVTPA